MRFKVCCAILGMFFAFGLVFLSHFEASGHEGDHSTDAFITAGEVDITSEAAVENFLNHIGAYYNQFATQDPGALTVIERELRLEGDYKHSATNMYSMTINSQTVQFLHTLSSGLELTRPVEAKKITTVALSRELVIRLKASCSICSW